MTPHKDDRELLCNIATTAFSVVGTLLTIDRQLAKYLRNPNGTSCQTIREECITSLMASALKAFFPSHIDLRLFTPADEKPTGADWYWHIRTSKNAIHALVQAKRVRWTKFLQADVNGMIDINASQINKLTAASNPPHKLPGLQSWVAIFAQIPADPPCGHNPLSECDNHGKHRCAPYAPPPIPRILPIGATILSQTPSVWIAQASKFSPTANQGVTQYPVRTLIKDMLRLDCLLPCIDPCSNGNSSQGPASQGFEPVPTDGIPEFEKCVTTIRDRAGEERIAGAIEINVSEIGNREQSHATRQ